MATCKAVSLKKRIALFFSAIYLAGFTNCYTHSDHSKVILSTALSYNEYIVTRQKELMEDVSMVNLSSEHDYTLALKMLDTLLKHSSDNLEDIEVLAPFKNDSVFKETAIDEFNFYRKMLSIKIKIDSETASDKDYANYNQYLKKIQDQSAAVESRLKEKQAKFARNNDILLTSSKKDTVH